MHCINTKIIWAFLKIYAIKSTIAIPISLVKKILRARSRPLHRHDDGLAILNQRHDVFGPQVQRFALFLVVSRPVVDTGNAALVSADVINNRLDDVRLHAQLGHASCCRPPQIMQHPIRNGIAKLLIQSVSAFRPAMKTRIIAAKNMSALAWL